jgi:hypothetical protein
MLGLRIKSLLGRIPKWHRYFLPSEAGEVSASYADSAPSQALGGHERQLLLARPLRPLRGHLPFVEPAKRKNDETSESVPSGYALVQPFNETLSKASRRVVSPDHDSTGTRSSPRRRAEGQASIENDWNDWYDRKHLPEIAQYPGFMAGSRYISVDEHGRHRYVAIYEIADPKRADVQGIYRTTGIGAFFRPR